MLLSFASALLAGPQYARVVVGMREVMLSPRAVVDDGSVYASADILKQLGASYVVGEHKVTIANGDSTVDLDLKSHNGSQMISLEAAAEALNADYSWDEQTSTARLMSKLTAVEFDGGTLTAKLSLPVSVSATRLWPNPWRISFDLPGAKLATSAKTFAVSGSSVSQIRLGQFDDDTTRLVVDVGRKMPYAVLTKGLSREIKISIGSAPATKVQITEKAPVAPAAPVTVNAIKFEPQGSEKACVRICTSGRPTFNTRMFADSLKIAVDIENATLDLPANDVPSDHPLFTAARAGQQTGSARVVLDLTRYVVFSADTDGNDIVVSLDLPVAAGGKLSEKTIVIDPGHGGYQGGASYGGVKEEDITLQIAEHVKAALQDVGAKVILTRTDDSYVGLPERPAVADKYSADFFISIHCNALGIPDKMTGIETYYHSGQASSRALASAIHTCVIQRTGMKDRGAHQDTKLHQTGLSVLRNANVPAILIECGYIDCAVDRSKLCDDSYKSKLAQAVVEGLRDYVEGKNGSGDR
jgi:N-acetylmuramoyl-L-alanine amidase